LSNVDVNNLTNIGVEKSTDVDVVKSTEVFICIDGQQRLTTTLLLCASLRDAILKLSINQVLSTEDENKKKAGN
jgi:uncharacterized protein with ParB-like and HNH nuclease domain